MPLYYIASHMAYVGEDTKNAIMELTDAIEFVEISLPEPIGIFANESMKPTLEPFAIGDIPIKYDENIPQNQMFCVPDLKEFFELEPQYLKYSRGDIEPINDLLKFKSYRYVEFKEPGKDMPKGFNESGNQSFDHIMTKQRKNRK